MKSPSGEPEAPQAEHDDVIPGSDDLDDAAVVEDAESTRRPFSIRRVLSLVMIGVLLILANASFASSAYYKLTPGPAPEITSMVSGDIVDPTFGQHGKIYFTTVQVDETTWWEYLWRTIVPEKGTSFIPKSNLGGGDREQQAVAAAAQMKESKEIAYLIAAQRTGVGSGTGTGAQIQSLVSGGAAERAGVTAGEVITAIDGSPVLDAQGAADLVSGKDAVTLELRRGETTRRVDVTLDQVDGKAVLGVQLGTEVAVDGPQVVEITTEGVGGPSAGLMFSLALTDALSEGDLTAGQDLAGTGTLDLTGKVGPISGIEDKVIGADLAGAEVFFAPASQATAATAAAPEGLVVVPVATYEDALAWLCANGGSSPVCPR